MSKRKSISLAPSEDELSSDSDASNNDYNTDSDDEMDKETPAEKRSRLARQYLDMVKSKTNNSDDEGDSDDGSESGANNVDMNAHLQILRQKATNTYLRPLANKLSTLTLSPPTYTSCKSTPTCVTLHKTVAAIGTKSGSAFTLNAETNQRTYITPKTASIGVLSIGINSTGTELACGLQNGKTTIYDLRTSKEVLTLSGHKSSITTLSYSPHPPHNLLTASSDRCIRHYTSTHQYIETLYGHQNCVTGLTWLKNKPITVSRDRTARIWDINHGTHGIYRPGAKGSAEDCVGSIGDKNFFSGSEDGSVRLWEVGKKKPLREIQNAHSGKWVVSCSGVNGGGSDIGVTGSWDGYVNLWSVKDGEKKKNMEKINELKCEGYVNGLAVDEEGRFGVVVCGREHRLGRWEVVKCKEREEEESEEEEEDSESEEEN
ncbi:hypothetical protein TL16_g05062 [Triparma laevis f. inornata]|uniref:WD40 repeat-like protein n=1 Tax=Triparma laevis f. inornata TaxID=1714386 RepID=A0A9W7AB52_9STRA|nr:hypothetical protein TL16_g05062 [Triparma laevis f. inornata]